MMNKKAMALALSAATLFSSFGPVAVAHADDKVEISLFNSKMELQNDFEDLAEEYGKDHNVKITVYATNDPVATHLSTKYASKDPYTLAMVDPKDIYATAAKFGWDMTGADWTKDTDYAMSVDGKVLGFPFCLEARGLLYNEDAIKEYTGEDFDPASVKDLDSFKALLDKLVEGGLDAPTAILKPDWSLAAHYFNQVYEEREDPQAFVDDLLAGKVDLMKDDKFNALMDTFDTLMEYNAFKDNAVAVEDGQVHSLLGLGEDAFQFGGSWEWGDLVDYDEEANVGIMPLPQDIQDDYSDCIIGGSTKYFYIDNTERTSDEQRQAALDFLNWLDSDDAGKTFISDTCGLVSPFKNNDVPSTNPIGKIAKEYSDAGKMVNQYDFDPDDHITKVGGFMQMYLAGQCTREELAKNIEDYWAGAKQTLGGSGETETEAE